MQTTFENYKEMYVSAYGICDDEFLKLAYLIDSRLEEAKCVVGSANKGVGYWVAEKLIGEGYRDTKGLAAVLKEATDEAIKRMNEDLGRRFIPIQDIVAPFGKSGSIIDLDNELEKIRSDRKNAVNEYLSHRDEEVRKETAKYVLNRIRNMYKVTGNCINYETFIFIRELAKDFGVEVEE